MMKVKFNKFERIAGLFVLVAFMGVGLTALSVAIKQGWFSTKVYFYTTFENADGLRQGTIVQMAGLRAGAVEDVELQGNNNIAVKFYILGKFKDRLREDSQVQLIRPFIIGERVLDVSVGSDEMPLMAERGYVKSIEAVDLMSLMSGRNLHGYLNRLSGILANVGILMEAFAEKSRAESMVRVFDHLDPLVKNMNNMSLEVMKLTKQATHGESLQKVVGNLAITTEEMNKILPAMNQQNPELAKDISLMMKNLALVAKTLGPAMAEVETDMPGATRRLVEVLDETAVVLKAMQKSFFMRSNVQEVQREENALRRLPANNK